MLAAPLPAEAARGEEALVKGKNIASLPDFDALPARIEAPVELEAGDDISTDEILPAGAQVLPLRGDIPGDLHIVPPRVIDPEYAQRTAASDGPHIIMAGENYGQGSSASTP